jgi:hypothetical protein
MHANARRRSKRLFDQEKGEGGALSQYDLAEVQMVKKLPLLFTYFTFIHAKQGFSSVCINLLENEFGCKKFTQEQKADMIHCWRLIGHHLGIADSYNTCNSLPDSEAMLAEYIQWTPARMNSCRPSTHELQRKCCDGFGKYTGLGVTYFEGLLDGFQKVPRIGLVTQYVKMAPYEGVSAFVRWWTGIMGGVPFINQRVSEIVVRARDHVKRDPTGFKRKQYYAGLHGQWMDTVVWPCFACFYEMSKTCLFLVSPNKVEGPAVYEKLATILGSRWAMVLAAVAFLWGGLRTTRALRRHLVH